MATSNEFLAASWHNAAVGNETPIDLGAATYRTIEEVRDAADDLGVAWWTVGPFGMAAAGELPDDELADLASDPLAIDPDAIALPITATPAYRGDGKALVTDLQAALSAGRRVVAVTAGVGSAQRLAEQLGAGRRRSPGRAGDHPLATGGRRRHRHDRAARPRPGRARRRAADRHRDRHPRPEGLHPGHGPDALAPAQHRRPAAARRRATSSSTSSTGSGATSR